MATVSKDGLESVEILSDSNNLNKLMYRLKELHVSEEEIKDFSKKLIEISKLSQEMLMLKVSDAISKVISATIAAFFSSTPASAAFLSAACYFLVDKMIEKWEKSDAAARSIAEKKGLDDISESLLEQLSHIKAPTDDSTPPEITNSIRSMMFNITQRLEMVREDLKNVHVFHFSAMWGVFVGANLGANLGFDWIGRSIVGVTCSFAIARCSYSFWNNDPSGSDEEFNRACVTKPIL
jgi:hypothetical protein